MKICICDNCNRKVSEVDFYPDFIVPISKTIKPDGKEWYLSKQDLCSECIGKIYNALVRK